MNPQKKMSACDPAIPSSQSSCIGSQHACILEQKAWDNAAVWDQQTMCMLPFSHSSLAHSPVLEGNAAARPLVPAFRCRTADGMPRRARYAYRAVGAAGGDNGPKTCGGTHLNGAQCQIFSGIFLGGEIAGVQTVRMNEVKSLSCVRCGMCVLIVAELLTWCDKLCLVSQYDLLRFLV